MTLNRRYFPSRAALGVLGVATAGRPVEARAVVATKARIVFIGAGAAGTSLANRLVRRLEGAEITILDGNQQHIYQPGLSLVATGLKPASYVVSQTGEWLQFDYDFLVVVPGLVLDHDAIEGFSLDLVGQNGIGALYAGPDYAAKTWAAASAFTETGGTGLFTRPATEMKCAGAPLKHTFLVDDIARRGGNAGEVNMVYAANNETLFGVPIVSEKVRMLFQDRGVTPVYSHVLKSVDPGKKIATFTTPTGDQQLDYDYLHVIPPQRAPEFVRQSGLSWADKWVDQGWVEVDKQTLRHLRYPDVFALGDVAGVPKGKTAASVKWQVPVVEDHLVAAIGGGEGTEIYDGYTSCPLITRIGRAMLVEFDYNNNLVPSFPGIIAPLEELWITWLMKEVALKATYNAMLRGRA